MTHSYSSFCCIIEQLGYLQGQAMLIGNHTGFASLVYPDDPHDESAR